MSGQYGITILLIFMVQNIHTNILHYIYLRLHYIYLSCILYLSIFIIQWSYAVLIYVCPISAYYICLSSQYNDVTLYLYALVPHLSISHTISVDLPNTLIFYTIFICIFTLPVYHTDQTRMATVIGRSLWYESSKFPKTYFADRAQTHSRSPRNPKGEL